jgi:preprotein translocase subunit SecF
MAFASMAAAKYRRLPDKSNARSSALGLMLDPDDVERFVDFEGRRTAILVRTSITGSSELGAAIDDVEAFVQRELSRDLLVTPTGESILIAQASDTISRELMTSLTWVLLAIFGFISLLFYSFKAGVLAMVPNLLPVLVNFGFMGLAGIPLSTATFPVAIIALGIAVDDTIHLMVRFAKELKGTSDNERALKRTIVRELQPVLTTSVALMVGFSTLLVGQFASTVQFGILATLAMLSALLTDLFLTPVLLRTTPLISAWDMLRMKISDQVMERSPLFSGLRRGEVKRVALLGDVRHLAALSVERVTWTPSGQRVELVRSLYRGDRYRFAMELVQPRIRNRDTAR